MATESQAKPALVGAPPSPRMSRRDEFVLGLASALIIRGGANLVDPAKLARSVTRQVDAFLLELDRPTEN